MAAAFLLLCMLAMAACTQTGFVAHDAPEDLNISWEDDGTPDSLETAVRHSIAYFRRLPPSHTVRFGKLAYTAEEMIRSHQLFLQLRREARVQDQFVRLLGERFHLFESISENGNNLFTGYFEPVIQGRKKSEPGFRAPLYELPRNLVTVELSRFNTSLPRQTLVGRLAGRTVLPFYSRKEIQEKAVLEGVAEPLAYVNEIDLFFLQIQGSGIVRFLYGGEIRVNYAAGNGHPYRSIGAELIRQEVLSAEEVTMQSIRAYLNANPESVRPLLNSNPSYTFFRQVENGPLGNIQVPLTPGRSLALDHRLLPKGALAYIETEATLFGDSATRPFRRFMLVQDTGGVIRGHGRADVFWGQGMKAEWAAGHMKHPGRLVLLVAKKAFLGNERSASGTALPARTTPQ
ncbi:MAG: MltA domain-containing protein [SAR324 cluster bacterium]|nr:MltA domain-containing protein [SAR324 cluster bacterium]